MHDNGSIALPRSLAGFHHCRTNAVSKMKVFVAAFPGDHPFAFLGHYMNCIPFSHKPSFLPEIKRFYADSFLKID